MRETRKASFDFALQDEGENLHNYKGVLKHYGIELEELRKFRPSATTVDLGSLDRPGALRIYSAFYWKYPGCDTLSRGLDYFVFDTGLVCGVERVSSWIGLLGGPSRNYEESLEYLNELGLEEALSGIEFYRRRRFKSSPLWPVLGAEWTNRCNRAKQRALRLGAGDAKERGESRLATA